MVVQDKIKKIESKWQKIWKENKTFESKINNSKEKYFATIAYPYANSVMHIGHGRTSTTCDILARYQRLKGKNVIYPMAFHITGTPVLAVADGISKGDEKQIKLTREAISDYVKTKEEQDKLLETFKEPMNIAKFFSSKIEETFDSIGLGIDWSRQFTTGDLEYNKFIEWQYSKLYEKGILTKGRYPILYSPVDKNAVGEDDIKDGDTEKVTLSEMTYILFQLKDSVDYLAIATLRPDALFGATNMWVDENMSLVKVNVEGKNWIVSKDTLIKIENQFENVKLISEHIGKEFIGKIVITPILKKEILVANASFIDSDHGTGIVYSSPAGSPHDFIALKEAKKEGRLPEFVNVINTVNTFDKNKKKIEYKGSCPAEHMILKYNINSSKDLDKLEIAKQELYKEEHFGGVLNENTGEFDGVSIKIAKDKVFDKLKELGLGGILYETSRKAKTRGGDKVIVAVLDEQWFLDYTKAETKKVAFDVLDNMEYRPFKLRDSQKGYLDWVQMRPCARKRGLGTKLPYDREWIIEALSDSTIYQMFYLIANTIYGEKIPSEKLIKEVFDFVLLEKGDLNEVAKVSGIDRNLIKKMRDEVDYWKSFDLRYTASTHMSNHLSFLIYHYGLIFPKKYWPNCITIGGLLIKDGDKISKSKDNGIPLFRIKDIYGADLFRLYIGVAANYDIEMDFKDNEIYQLEKKYGKLISLIEESIDRPKKKYEEYSQINKWLISKFYSRAKDFFKFFDEFRVREAYVTILYEFLSDVNYHERRTSYDETLDVMSFIAHDYLKLMTPVIPHMCEELNEKMGFKTEISLQAFETDFDKYIDLENEKLEKIIETIIANVSRNKDAKNIIELKKIQIITASKLRYELFDFLNLILNETRDFKSIFDRVKSESRFTSEMKFVSKFLPKTIKDGLTTYVKEDVEKELLNSTIKFIENEFNCKLEIISADGFEKEVNAIPGEPFVIIE